MQAMLLLFFLRVSSLHELCGSVWRDSAYADADALRWPPAVTPVRPFLDPGQPGQWFVADTQ